MRINSRLKKVLSLLAIAFNAALLCLMIYELIATPPKLSEWLLPAIMGLFLVINIIALVPGTYENEQKNFLFNLFGNSKVRLALMALTSLVCIILGFWMGYSSYDKIEMWKWKHKQNIKMAEFMGKKAPDVVGKTLDGKDWKLREQTGKVVLLDFWATWCGPCVASIPKVKKIYEKYKSRDDFMMVGVSLDTSKEELIEYCKKQELPWIMLLEEDKSWDNSIVKAFEIASIPSCWIIDKKGNVAGMNIHSSKHEEIEQLIKKNLGGDTNEPNL
jgi:peroxiredoxin